MKSKWSFKTIIGVGLFLLIVGGSAWFLRTSPATATTEINLEETVSMIEKGRVREAFFKQSGLEITDVDGKKYFASIGSDATRERLFVAIGTYNKNHNAAPITFEEAPASSGWGWIILIQAAQLALFFGFWIVTLGAIVWAVRTISGNKG